VGTHHSEHCCISVVVNSNMKNLTCSNMNLVTKLRKISSLDITSLFLMRG
jgi:hypothetical protein